jgi:hypothetical protein
MGKRYFIDKRLCIQYTLKGRFSPKFKNREEVVESKSPFSLMGRNLLDIIEERENYKLRGSKIIG